MHGSKNFSPDKLETHMINIKRMLTTAIVWAAFYGPMAMALTGTSI